MVEVVRRQLNVLRDAKVLYVSEHTNWGLLGYQTVLSFAARAEPIFWASGDPVPCQVEHWAGDWIISFKSDLILPAPLLGRARFGAINFHPGPPKYRGVGGYYWALKNGDSEYGVTCHAMTGRIDHGSIFEFEPFVILGGESVSGLRFRTAINLLAQLERVLSRVAVGEVLTPTGIQWSPHLYTYRELREAQHGQ